MATRHARTADKALNEKHASILKGLLRSPANKYCADCKRKDPRWASWNLGIFVCIRCSGIHRSMGTHISKVKSVDLDTWVPDQVDNMVRWGNERANKYWEANLKDKRPSESNIDMWIRAKYEQKRWAMRGPIPDPSTLGGEERVVESPTPKQEQPKQQQSPQPKPKKSEFANLDAFLGSPTSTPAQPAAKASSPASQLQGADFFFGSSSSAPTTNTAPPKQEEKPKSKHDDFKSSILSLYNTAPAVPSMPVQNNNASYMNNMSNFQQQLSGLSLGGPSSGMIPQAPPGHSFQNVWGSFTDASTNPIRPSGPSQNALPQGSQFFGSNGNSSTNTPPPKAQPAYDAFADLLK